MNSTKITITKPAWRSLVESRSQKFSWTEIGTNDLFFSIAPLDHDKVIDHGPPYLGVWLHKEGDLIIEHQTISDEDVIQQCPGHAYLLANGKLERHETTESCKCGMPESHDKVVMAALRLGGAIEKRNLSMIPHPLNIPSWHVVF